MRRVGKGTSKGFQNRGPPRAGRRIIKKREENQIHRIEKKKGGRAEEERVLLEAEGDRVSLRQMGRVEREPEGDRVSLRQRGRVEREPEGDREK